MSDRFMYHALAVGVSGRIQQPFEQIIPAQASLALPETGGFATTRVENYSLPGILSFAAAYAVVSGALDPRYPGGSHETLATVTIEGLNILSMITADRIVARITSSHPVDGSTRSITPLGSYIEGLRIGGNPVQADLATDTFTKFDNADKVRAAYRDDQDNFREEFHRLTLAGRGEYIPEDLRRYFPLHDWTAREEIPETNGIIAGSLVREISGLPRSLSPFGNIIPFAGFGRIRLAEFKLTNSSLQVNMLQVDLGSTPMGLMAIGGTQGNGSDW